MGKESSVSQIALLSCWLVSVFLGVGTCQCNQCILASAEHMFLWNWCRPSPSLIGRKWKNIILISHDDLKKGLEANLLVIRLCVESEVT